MKPRRVAITMRVVQTQAYHDPRDALSQDWVRYLLGHDCLPLLVPNHVADVPAYVGELKPELVILSNGNDVGPVDEAEEAPATYAPERDELERKLIDLCIASGTPILGVCRGLQFLNVYFGGALCRNLASASGSPHAGVDHDVSLHNERLQVWAGAPDVSVNSFHNDGILEDQLAEDLKALASAGPVVEAFLHQSLPILGLQWHPERPGAPASLDEHILAAAFNGYKDLR